MLKLTKITRLSEIIWNGNSISCSLKFEFSNGHVIERDYIFLFSNFDGLTNNEIFDFYKKNSIRLNSIITSINHYQIVRANFITFNTIDKVRTPNNNYSVPIVSIGIVSIF